MRADDEGDLFGITQGRYTNTDHPKLVIEVEILLKLVKTIEEVLEKFSSSTK